jgi:hypothetical protein
MNKTHTFKLIFPILLIFVLGTVSAWAQSGVICGKPGSCVPVYRFKAWDLPFSTGRQAKFKAGETAESDEFYAVILDSTKIGFSEGDRCDDFKAKRLTAQKAFPNNKVFASDYCNLENIIIYNGFGDWHERNLLAVFVGQTGDNYEPPQTISESATQEFLKKARKKYPKAQLVKMTAMIDYTRR